MARSIGSFKLSLKTHLFSFLASHVPHLSTLYLLLAWLVRLAQR